MSAAPNMSPSTAPIDAIEITIFTEKPGTPARYVNQGERVPCTLAELFSEPLPRETPKDDLPFYSGTRWEGDNRSEGTPYLAERFLGYDLDAVPVPSRETVRAVMTALGLTWHLTPSSSHTPAKPALRLVIDPHQDIAPADFPRVSKALAERFAEHLTFPVASNSHSHAHCWCWPRVPEGGEWFYDSGKGSRLDVEGLLRDAPPALADVEANGPALVKPATGAKREQGRQRAIMHAGTGPGQIGPCIEKDKHGRNGQAWIWRAAQYLGLTCKHDLDTAWAIFDEHYNPLCFARDGVTPYPWPREGKQGFDRAFKRAVRSGHAASDAATAKLAESFTAKNAATSAPPVASDEAPAGMTSDAASAPEVPPATVGERPTLHLGSDLESITTQAVEALAADTNIFHRGSDLVRIVRSGATTPIARIKRPEGAPTVRPVTTATLRERLATAARWEKFDRREKAWVKCLPLEQVVQAVAARSEWPGLRALVGIAEAPLLRASGSILQRPGYDEESGYFYAPSETFPAIPDAPTQEDAFSARDALLEVVQDFPFATESHRSAWLAFLLTLFARPAIDGPVPFAAIDATTRGTGKGKLTDATSLIALGREAAKIPQPEDDKECRKFISMLVDEGEVFAMFDNIVRVIDYPSLDAALTAGVWKDRILGTNRSICAPMQITWGANGNNLQFGGDTARRTLHIRLESPLENPENRDDFEHPDLLEWVRSERPRLVVAALTILRGYVVAGRSDMKCKAWGSYEAWSHLIANAVVWVGMADPQDTRTELESVADTSKGALGELMAGLTVIDRGGVGLTARGVIDRLYSGPLARLGLGAAGETDSAVLSNMRDALESLCPAPPGKHPTSAQLGKLLRSVKRRVVGGRMFDARTGHGGIMLWRVVNAGGSK